MRLRSLLASTSVLAVTTTTTEPASPETKVISKIGPDGFIPLCSHGTHVAGHRGRGEGRSRALQRRREGTSARLRKMAGYLYKYANK